MSSKFEYVSRGTSVRYVEPHAAFLAVELDAFLLRHRCDDVTISKVHGRNQADLDEVFLSKRTKKLSVVMDSASFSRLAENRTIERIYFNGMLNEEFDFSSIKNLHALTIQWQETVQGIDRASQIEELNLIGFRGESSYLGKLISLRTLGLSDTNLTSVAFLKTLPSLERLTLSYARKLEDLSGLSSLKTGLLDLELDHLPRLRDYGVIIGSLKGLKKLKVTKCAPLPDVEFIRNLPALEFFSFVDTNIVSGDLSPCLGLKYVGFLDKKHYNYTWNRNAERLEAKGGHKGPSREGGRSE